MKHILLLLSMCLFSTVLFAQNTYSVKGSVADTVTNVKLANTTIAVLNAKDSTLRRFTRAAADGSFTIGKLGKGKFILLVTYPKYADYVEDFTLDSVKNTHNFGRISMILKSRLLASVMVKGTRAAIKIKGDTTEFNASSFTVQPNAKVEDLLKQLPGIQVDKDGKITAQGQAVNKVLVDGEEFFGDDPTLVTKNLRADMVDKVQLYDKASDQASFTGIDDGQKAKTINIKLKEDKKNGYFGKADVGIGTKDFYQGQVAINKFAGKEKISAYGTLSNTGKTGLGWEDSNKFGTSGNNIEFMDGGGISISSNGGDEIEGWGGRYNGEGIPVARTGGLHYDNKWNADKQAINGNYKLGSLNVTGSRNTQTQNNLPTGFIKTNSDQIFDNNIFRQKADAAYTLKIDSTSNIKLAFDGTFKTSESRSRYQATSFRGNQASVNDTLLNTNNREIDTDGDQQTYNFSAFYTKKFKKVGRTISVNLIQSLDNNKSTGFLKSDIDLYDRLGALESSTVIDQLKQNKIRTSVFNSNITYSEPFSKTFSLLINYGLGISNSDADRNTYEQSSPGNYNVLVPVLSNNYRLDQLTNQGGAVFNYKKDKTTFNFGTKVGAVNFQQLNKANNNEFDRNFINWNPQASYQYRFSQQKAFRFNYNGNTQQPRIDQIQPIIINTDPLFVTLGNPLLKPSFTNRFSMTYNSYKVISNRSIWVNGSYSFTSNPIVGNVTTDENGFTTSQAVNLSGRTPSNFYLNAQIDSKVKFLFGMNVGLQLSTNGNTYYNMVNGQENRTRSYTYSSTINLSRYKEKKFEFYGNIGPNYTTSQSSLQKQANNNGAGFTTYHYFTYYLPGKFQIGSDGNYEYRAKTQSFNTNFSRFLLNAFIQKSFLKDESLKLRANVNDIFNQNSGFSRSASGNYITQDSFTTIKRYFMFSIIYDFSKMGGSSSKK
jgi:outer membrane receptor protein involved in Fe transport